MANYKKHLSTSTTICCFTSLVKNLQIQNRKIEMRQQPTIDWQEIIGTIVLDSIAGGIGGVLPDILEPAKDPNHRQTFHSLTVATLICYGLDKTCNSKTHTDTKNVILSFSIGYLSHLFLDMQTAKSLPIT